MRGIKIERKRESEELDEEISELEIRKGSKDIMEGKI